MSKTILLLVAWLASLPAMAGSAWDPKGPSPKNPLDITVYRSPTCQCCGFWMMHMQKHGFRVDDRQTEDMAAVKDKYGVPSHLQSCHTAVVNGYVVEGHVPAADVLDLLKKKTKIAGLTVPGMPSGTPGMDRSERKDPFAVLEFGKDGKSKVFHQYDAY
jgi:hypothetical protein